MTRKVCIVPECGRNAAPEHSWCHAHVIAHALSLDGYCSIEQAREIVRNGARADNFMHDDDDWIADA